MSSVNPLYTQLSTQPLAGPSGAAGMAEGADSDFSDLFSRLVSETSDAEFTSSIENMGLLSGDNTNIHSVVLAAEKAEIALRLTLQIRNKVLDAYNEIMRMQV